MNKNIYFISITILSLASCVGNQGNLLAETIEPTVQSSIEPSILPSAATETTLVASNACKDISNQERNVSDKEIGLIVSGRDNIYFYNVDFTSCYYFPDSSMQNYLSPDGYSIIGISYSSGKNKITIQIKDFKDQTLSKHDYQLHESEYSRLFDFTISPDLKWVAYKRIDGEIFGIAGEDANHTKVKIVELASDQPLEPVEVTEQDGAHHAKLTWSPDGRYLAFPDFDINGVTQIFFYDPLIKQKTRITDFTEREREYGIGRILWSPDSGKFIFTKGKFTKVDSYLYNYVSTESLGVFTLSSRRIDWIDIDERRIHDIWVGHNNNVMLNLDGNLTKEPLIIIYNLDSMTRTSTIRPKVFNEFPDYSYFIIPGDGDFNHLLIGGTGNVSYNVKDDSYIYVDSYPFQIFFRVILTPSGLLPNIQ